MGRFIDPYDPSFFSIHDAIREHEIELAEFDDPADPRHGPVFWQPDEEDEDEPQDEEGGP